MNNRTVYMIGGTTEANRAAGRLKEEGYRVVVSVATSLGRAMASAGEIEIGRKDASGIAEQARQYSASVIVDCSHPFAGEVSDEAAQAAAIAELPYLRYCRPDSGGEDSQPRVSRVDTWPEAVEFIKQRGGRALLAIGTRNLGLFTDAGLDIAARVLSRTDSLAQCERLGIEAKDIISAFPPHSEDFNRACIRHVGAEILVTKDSGSEGGLEEKISAARVEGIEVLIVNRPAGNDNGEVHDLESLMQILDEVIAT